MSESTVYIALRVGGLLSPYVSSERMACCGCNQPVWVDPLSYAAALAEQDSLRVLCVSCATSPGRPA